MRRATRGLLLVVVAALYLAPAAGAQRAEVRPVSHVDGLSGPELLRQWWSDFLQIPVSEHPFFGAGDPCTRLGQHDRVVLPILALDTTTTTCVIRPGTPVLVTGLSSECSDVEPPPFFAVGEAAQQACARENDLAVEATLISVDGGPTIDIRDPRFEVISPQGTVELPPDNLLGVEPQTATFAAHAWLGLIRGLTPGEHVITIEVVGGPLPVTGTVVLEVTAGKG
jgi:hypothetical protein